MKKTGCHINVKGTVQGVGFRYYCRVSAEVLGLNGFIMNMPDGSVEMEVFGEQSLIDDYIREISRRDRSYLVQEIVKYEIPDNKEYTDFQVLHHPED